MNVIALLPVSTLGLPKYPPPPRLTEDHRLYSCDKCERDCWIGPEQLAAVNQEGCPALCFFCILEESDDEEVQT